MKTKAIRSIGSLLTAAAIAALLPTPALRAEDASTAEIIKQLQQRVEELERQVKTLQSNQAPVPATNVPPAAQERIDQLDQQVRVLQRNRELDAEAAQEKARRAPKISIGGDGFAFTSADDAFAIQLKGVLQVDSRTFFGDSIVGNDSLLLRRARPIMQGTVFKDFDFLFVPDFAPSGGPTIFDAFVNYRYSPELQLRAGKYKVPVGLEYLQADSFTLFNERGLPTALVPGRDIGFDLHGDLLGATISYDVGIFNGVGDARNSSNVAFQDDKSLAARLFFQPFRQSSTRALQGVGFGVAGTYEGIQGTSATALPATTGGTLPGYTTDGQQQWFAYTNTVASGNHWRLSPQGYYFYGPFSLLTEYAISDQEVTSGTHSARLDNTAWQVSGGWILTGEEASYNAPITPRHPFNPGQGGWGAWQLVARYGQINIDDSAFPNFANPAVSARSMDEWAVGVNWWLNRNVRVNASFSHATFEGGGSGSAVPGIVNRQDENVLFTRVQLAF